jgi:hypothetical protein
MWEGAVEIYNLELLKSQYLIKKDNKKIPNIAGEEGVLFKEILGLGKPLNTQSFISAGSCI